MNAAKDGGPAYPTDANRAHLIAHAATRHLPEAEREQAYIVAQAQALCGATLRDFFAVEAMASIAPRFGDLTGSEDSYAVGPAARIARRAYIMADAMLKARQP